MKEKTNIDAQIEQLQEKVFMKIRPGIEASRDGISDLMLLQSLMKYNETPNLNVVEEHLQQEILNMAITKMDDMINLSRLFSELAAVKMIIDSREHNKK